MGKIARERLYSQTTRNLRNEIGNDLNQVDERWNQENNDIDFWNQENEKDEESQEEYNAWQNGHLTS